MRSAGSSQSLIGLDKNGAILKEYFVQSCNFFRPGGKINVIDEFEIIRLCHMNVNFGSLGSFSVILLLSKVESCTAFLFVVDAVGPEMELLQDSTTVTN